MSRAVLPCSYLEVDPDERTFRDPGPAFGPSQTRQRLHSGNEDVAPKKLKEGQRASTYTALPSACG